MQYREPGRVHFIFVGQRRSYYAWCYVRRHLKEMRKWLMGYLEIECWRTQMAWGRSTFGVIEHSEKDHMAGLHKWRVVEHGVKIKVASQALFWTVNFIQVLSRVTWSNLKFNNPSYHLLLSDIHLYGCLLSVWRWLQEQGWSMERSLLQRSNW